MHFVFTTDWYYWGSTQYTDGRDGVLDETGGKEHNITEAAPNELKLGEGG